MNFNTVEFVLIFLPATLAAFYLAPVRLRIPVLLLASLVFYGASGLLPLSLLVGTIVWGFAAAFWLRRIRWRTAALFVAIVPPLLVLFLFKYLGFAFSALGVSESARGLVPLFLLSTLPAGISFYTFQVCSYLIDVGDGKLEREDSALHLFTFIALFPQLIAGPILRYSQIRDQLHRISTQKTLRPDIRNGLKLLSVGLFYKTFFADVVRSFQESFSLAPDTGSLDVLYSVVAYSFVIYYDFWGYSLMAIGMGRLLSIDLPRNFLEPYLARTPREFWRRWHVTLSYWLRDYVYLRLGGNASYVRNIAIVFVACGLWHGAGWNFVLWGAYHAVFVILYHFSRRLWDRLPAFAGIALTFAVVTIGWPLFYLDAAGYVALLGRLVSFEPAGAAALYSGAHWAYLTGVAAWSFLVREDWWLFNDRPLRVFDSPVVHGGLFVLSVMFLDFGRKFIYFQF